MSPRRITAFIWISFLCLGLLCIVYPKHPLHLGNLQLRWPTLATVLDIDTTTHPPIILPESLCLSPIEDTLIAQNNTDTATVLPLIVIESSTEGKRNLNETSTKPQRVGNLPMPTDSAIDTRTYLSAFYTALTTTQQQSIRIVHYGDSQIEEDRMTLTLRQILQKRFGGGGVGLIPLHQTIPTRTLQQSLTMNGRVLPIQQGPARNLVYGPKAQRREDKLYGPMGQVAHMNDSLLIGSEDLLLSIQPRQRKHTTEHYFSRIRLLADTTIHTLSPQGDTLSAPCLFTIRDSTTHFNLHLFGKGAVYGISLETPTGIIVDNIPMRGSIGTIFTNIDQKQLSRYYKDTNTRLIILQFGGNAIPYNEKPSTLQSIVRMIRRQVVYLRQCAPQAAILFVGPSDMLTLINGTPTSYPLLPYFDQLLLRMAQEEEIGYFSLLNAMGGIGSMQQWQKKGWAGSDGVHFTRRGAENAGKQLANWLLDENFIQTKPSLSTPQDSLSHSLHSHHDTTQYAYQTLIDTIAYTK